ncbi:HAD family phosphatase [Roseivirga sp. E12]|uniref:HAD family hydrolase n=1 Tax=Roseivirga sp. E12 TaxID=2819237 RepID=UPI001ABC0F1B|nr:HAD family phosphatase [Roseivirga sp. E12]MBO3697885.1 HAD family phosphatase [Roseivirga sp. E12]
MALDITEIDAIVFDLGGVILDLHIERTYQAFAGLGDLSLEEVKQLSNLDFFKQYETGDIDDPTFRAHLREELEFKGAEDILDEAWNAMIGPIAKNKFELLDQLSSTHKLYLMSNTNEIHMKRILRIANHISSEKHFYKYFDKVFLSCEVGERKPNVGFYEHLMHETDLAPDRTLFIDDLEENITTAKNLGWKGHHLKPDESIVELLNQSNEY